MDYQSPAAPYFQGMQAADPNYTGPVNLDFSTPGASHATLAGYQQQLATLQPQTNPASTSFQYDSLTPRTLPNGMANPMYDPNMTPANLRDSATQMAALARGEQFTPTLTDAQRWQQASLNGLPLVQKQQQDLQGQYLALQNSLRQSHSNMEFSDKLAQMRDIESQIKGQQGQIVTLQNTQSSLSAAAQQQLRQAQYYAGQNPAQFGDQAPALVQGFSPAQLAIGEGDKSQVNKAGVAVDYLNQHGITDPAKREAFTKAVSGGLGFTDFYTIQQQQQQAAYEQQQVPIKKLASEIIEGKLQQDPTMGNAWYRMIPDPNTPDVMARTMGGAPKMIKQYLDPAFHPVASQAFKQASNGASPMPVQPLSDSDKALVADIVQKKNLPADSNPYEVLKAAQDEVQKKQTAATQVQTPTDWTKNLILAPAEGGVAIKNLAEYAAKGILNAPIAAVNAATGTQAITPFAQGNAVTPTPQQWGTLNRGYQQLQQGAGDTVSSIQQELRHLLGVKTPEEKARIQQLQQQLATLK